MPTSRSESIRLSLSDTLGLARDPNIHGDAAYKVDRYAHLARFIDAGIGDFLADEQLVSYVTNASTKENIARNFTQLAWLSIRTPGLQAVLDAHAEHGMADLGLLLHGGIRTFAVTTQSVYDHIRLADGAEAAGLSGNAALIDKLAKMDLEQFNPYDDYYLRSLGRSAFIEHLERTPSGYRFKPGYPQAALIPASFRYGAINTPYFSDDHAPDSPLIRIGDIPRSPATVGCPVTFNPARMPELWAMYVTARETLDRRQRFGGQVIAATDAG